LLPIEKAKGIAAIYGDIGISKEKAIVHVKALYNQKSSGLRDFDSKERYSKFISLKHLKKSHYLQTKHT
jgi:hypothetical protein